MSAFCVHCYYSAQKLILILLSHGGRRLSRPSHCSKGVQPVPKAVYRSDVYSRHANAHGAIRTHLLICVCSSRVIEVQKQLSERAVELLALPEDVPSFILDVG